MRILYLHQYFKTPKEGGATRSYHLAKKMVEKGWRVDLITSHNSKDYLIRKIDGIRVHYLPIPYSNSFGKWKRIQSFFSFAQLAKSIAVKLSPDLCYATSTPLTIGWVALKISKRIGVPFIFEVRDLWPEAPEALGIVRNPLVLKLAYQLAHKTYKRADKIISLSPGMTQEICKVVSEDKVLTVPNLCHDQGDIIKTSRSQQLKITYAGALGYVNNIPLIEQIIDQVELLDGITFEVIGEGKFADDLKEYCCSKVHTAFIGQLCKSEVFERLKDSDVSLTTFLDVDILGTNSPNKFFDGLACATVVLVNNQGWTKDLVETHECGFHFDSHSFASIIRLLRDDTQLLEHYQMNALRLSKQFDANKLCDQIISEIDDSNLSTKVSEVYNQID